MKISLFSKLCALVVLFALSSGSFSNNLLADTYVGGLAGVECEGCKKTIAKSIAKLSGVQTIRIKKIADLKHEMVVITDGSALITHEQVSEAIKHAEHYKIQSWTKSKEEHPTTASEATKTESTDQSWLKDWEKIIGTWAEEDGPTFTFGWKFPGKILETHVKWGESEKYTVTWKHPETGEISTLSLDNKGGQSEGTWTFAPEKATIKEVFKSNDGRTGDKLTEYTVKGDTLTMKINDGKPRTLKRQ